MSTILRGNITPESKSILQSSELNIEVKAEKENRNSFIIDITDKDFQDFDGQIADTIDFLNTQHSQLMVLKSQIPGMFWYIDYGYNTKVATGELVYEGLRLPLELIRLCSELQIEILLSLYDGKQFE